MPRPLESFWSSPCQVQLQRLLLTGWHCTLHVWYGANCSLASPQPSLTLDDSASMVTGTLHGSLFLPDNGAYLAILLSNVEDPFLFTWDPAKQLPASRVPSCHHSPHTEQSCMCRCQRKGGQLRRLFRSLNWQWCKILAAGTTGSELHVWPCLGRQVRYGAVMYLNWFRPRPASTASQRYRHQPCYLSNVVDDSEQ